MKQSEKINPADKSSVLKALKDAEKETEILKLKLAAQNRELEIQACLERVRASAMSMKEPADMLDVCRIISEQLELLEVKEIRNVQTAVFYESKGIYLNYEYYRLYEKNFITEVEYNLQPDVSAFVNQMLKDADGFFTRSFDRRELKDWIAYQRKVNQFVDPRLNEADSLHYYFYSIGPGALGLSTYNIELNGDELDLLKRFRNVFELAYRRFVDIEQAIAQAKEAQIEAALERVRARAVSMRKPEDLLNICEAQFTELKKLGFSEIRNTIITIFNDEKGSFLDNDYSDFFGGNITNIYYHSHHVVDNFLQMVKSTSDAFAEIILEGDQLNDWKDFRRKTGQKDDPRLENIPALYYYFYSIGIGAVGISTFTSINSEKREILKRFRNVFELSYRRFVDIEQAMAQAREAKIEASLERVRTKAMAMHSSGDLAETIGAFYHELSSLSLTPRRCGVGLIDKETRITELSTLNTTDKGDSIEVIGRIKLEAHPVLEKIYDNWLTHSEYHPVLRGNEIKEYYKTILPQISFPDYSGDTVQYGYFFYFPEGAVYSWTMKELTEDELQIYRRFTSVLSLTYRRFMDLKEAEQRAFEAVRQASLDRVRAEIASMRTVEDLQRITPIIWHELKTLDVPFIRCGVFIVDERNFKVRVFLTTPDGRSLGVLNLPVDVNEVTASVVDHWRKEQIYRVHWNEDEFISWTNSMIRLGQVQDSETYQGAAAPPESLDLHFVPFTQGMLYVGNTSPLPDDKIQIVRSLAESFSIAYARYEDFKNLEEAKSRIEITLNELKSAQAQLIHSEKMASLGELTAGIAHEIKNPLNFVNNFSELSQELLDEMQTEFENGSKEEVIEIINNLKRNLVKINYHGKRADSIVKGMLLHSRGGSGEKVLTNINDLLDQYVTLVYHGLRAQDSAFNITIEKNYDESIEKINIVPQDISRVFLNVINNACYAANEKKKKIGNDFEPILNISTRNLLDKIEIRIKDNGIGIPEEVLDKLFNPFFTTKPAGEGTGLGLSLSYDIVTKMHGGEIKVETKEGEGAEFIITLPF